MIRVNKILVVFLSVLLMSSCVFATGNYSNAYGSEAAPLFSLPYSGELADGYILNAQLKEKQLLKERYLVGEVLSIPENTILVDGAEHAATSSVLLPDGTAVRSKLITLSKAGKYTVTYTAKVGEKYYSDSISFYAENNAINGTAHKNPETGFVDCTLSNMEVLSYNIPIDLTNMTKDDELISLFINASEIGVKDFQEYIIVLTDAYDSTNSVYVRVKSEVNFSTNPNDSQYYSRYQAYVGVDFHDRNQFVGCEKDKIHRASIYGTPIHNSFCNMSKADSITREQDALSLRYDNAEKAFYVTSPAFYLTPTIVADLDNPAHFNTAWSGFHNNTVYISLYAKEVVGTANITVKHIGGNELITGAVEDTTPPSVTVDYGNYSEDTIPCAVVGSPYRLFSASAEDLHLSNANVKCKVYYNYSGSNARMVEIKNGAFIPDYAGTYTVVYCATDDYGNKAEQFVYVNAIRSDAIDFTVQNGDAASGEKIEIPAPTVADGNVNTGIYSLKILAVSGEKEEILYNGALRDYSPVEYRFMSVGECRISYIVSDYSRDTKIDAVYSVTSGGNVIADAFEDLAIDRCFISGNSYILPTVNVISFSGEGSSYPAKIKVIYGDNRVLSLESNVFIPTDDMGSTVQIVYYDGNNEDVNISGSREIHSIGADGEIDLGGLFASENAAVVPTEGSIDFVANQNAEILMLAKQYAEEFKLQFNLYTDVEAGNTFGNFDIVLTDSLDKNISVKINIKNTLNSKNIVGEIYNSLLYINDNPMRSLELLQSFAGVNAAFYNITYSNITNAISIDGNALSITECQNGEAFNGFPSGAVYVSYGMSSVNGDVRAEIYSVNSQYYSSYEYDNSRPQVVVNGTYKSLYQYGELINTLPAFGIDAICGYSGATVTVRMVDGGVLKSVDGIELSNADASKIYSIRLSEYGEYFIQYTTADRYGNKATLVSYSFTVEDSEKPTVEIKGELQKYAFVGDKLKLPELQLGDNYSENIPLYVVTITPNGVYKMVNPNDFTFADKGTYKIILTAIDAGGNMTNVSYYTEVI